MTQVEHAVVTFSVTITRDYTPRGSKVTCSYCGFHICEVVVDDARSGTYPDCWSNVFGNWRVPEPRRGMLLSDIRCPHCGGRWVKDKAATGGAEFVHFEGYGWWPGIRSPRTVPFTSAVPPYAVRRPWWERALHKMGFRWSSR